MLRYFTPDHETARRFQDAEQRPFWSGCVDAWLRKWGLITADGAQTGFDPAQDYAIVARGAHIPHGPSFIEGPIADDMLAALGLKATARRSPAFRLTANTDAQGGEAFDPQILTGLYPSAFGYSQDTVRRIPDRFGETSEPYLFDDSSVGDPKKPTAFQTFPDLDADWSVLARAVWSGAEAPEPVVISRNGVTVCGLPIFDLFCEKMSMPALPAGWYASDRLTPMPGEEIWIANAILRLCREAGAEAYRLAPWPNGAHTAVTIRHDYDRPITDYELARLLSVYRTLGLKASCGFLARLTPAHQGRMLLDEGHEICLHSEKSDPEGVSEELAALKDAFGVNPVGVTAHGGVGATGHLGEAQYTTAEALGLSHAETLGRTNLLPHCALVAPEGDPRVSDVVAMGLHRSLDIGTAPDAHNLEGVLKTVKMSLSADGHVNIMNHPDIHVPELLECLMRLPSDRTWNATHAEIADWTRKVKYGVSVDESRERRQLKFADPLPEDATLIKVSPGAPGETVLKRGEIAAPLDAPGSTIELFDAFLKPRDYYPLDQLRNINNSYAEKRKKVKAMTKTFDGPCGVIIRKDAELETFWTEMAKAAELDPVSVAPRMHVFSGGGVGIPSPFGDAATVFCQPVFGLYEKTIIARTVRMFDGPWGLGLVALANYLTKPGGEVVLPLSSKNPAPVLFYVGALRDLFDQKGRISPCKRYIAFTRSETLEMPRSIFSWALDNAATLHMEELSASANSVSEDPLVDEFLRQSENVSNLLGKILGDRSDLSGDAATPLGKLKTYVGSMDYLVTGIGYKAPIIAHIIREQCGGDRPISYLDMGGGFGALAAELLLSPQISVTRGETRDIAPQNLLYARRLYASMRDVLKDRYFFSLGRSETFEIDQKYDVLSFVGSLLYAPREDVADMLARLWDALNPGGLMIIHENIKAEGYARDFDVMFEPEELEGYLRPFGDIRYYSSTTLLELPADDIDRKTVFRVVQKP